jgi:hypothetical protein
MFPSSQKQEPEEERPSKKHKGDKPRSHPSSEKDSSSKSKAGIRGLLSSRERDECERRLHFLTLERDDIFEFTIFAMEHAEGYEEVFSDLFRSFLSLSFSLTCFEFFPFFLLFLQVVDLICASLLQPSLPVFSKIARLYAISDILHNSSLTIQYVWRYRSA